jgi:hypothetical protein
MAVEAVTCEPVSLLLGDYQRSFGEKQRQASLQMSEMPLAQAFPTFDVKLITARNSEGQLRTTPMLV